MYAQRRASLAAPHEHCASSSGMAARLHQLSASVAGAGATLLGRSLAATSPFPSAASLHAQSLQLATSVPWGPAGGSAAGMYLWMMGAHAAHAQAHHQLQQQQHHMRADDIVSLCPGATDALVALGLGARLSGVTDVCSLPPSLANHVVRRGNIALADV